MFIPYVRSDTHTPEPDISKIFYKLNKKNSPILEADMAWIRHEFADPMYLIINSYIADQDEVTIDQSRAIKAIVFLCETQPFRKEMSYVEDTYFFLLLPFLEQILFKLRIFSSLSIDDKKLEAFESLKKIFIARLSIGFGQFKKTYITARDLSKLAKHDTIRPIQNSLSARGVKDLKLASENNGKGLSLKLSPSSARIWLAAKKRNKLVPIETKAQLADLNVRLGLNYLNDFKCISFRPSVSSIEELANKPGIYIFLDSATNQIIYIGKCDNLQSRVKRHFTRLNSRNKIISLIVLTPFSKSPEDSDYQLHQLYGCLCNYQEEQNEINLEISRETLPLSN